MVGITLSAEQVQSAPPEVRHWIEQQIAAALGMLPTVRSAAAPANHIVACSLEEAGAIFMAVRSMLPVVSVFFELGREMPAHAMNGLSAVRLADVLRHTRLPDLNQLGLCLQLINVAFQRLRDDPQEKLLLVNHDEYCLLATQTQRHIQQLWRQIVANQVSMPLAAPDAEMPHPLVASFDPASEPGGSGSASSPQWPGGDVPALRPDGSSTP